MRQNNSTNVRILQDQLCSRRVCTAAAVRLVWIFGCRFYLTTTAVDIITELFAAREPGLDMIEARKMT